MGYSTSIIIIFILMSSYTLSLLPSRAELRGTEPSELCVEDGSYRSVAAAPPAPPNHVLHGNSCPRCIAVAATCMLLTQLALVVSFVLVPRIKASTPAAQGGGSCHQPEEESAHEQQQLRYVPHHLRHAPHRRDVEPSKVPIFCVFRNTGYRELRKVVYRLGTVPYSFCTHLLYHSARYSSGAIVSRDELFDEVYQGFTVAANMRRIWTHLRVLLTLYVSEPETADFSEDIQGSAKAALFSEAAYRWLAAHNFDGLNVDWPYAGGPCGSESDPSNYAALLRSLKARFESRFMLTVAVPGELASISKGLDLRAASTVADFLLLRSEKRKNVDPLLYDCPGHAVSPRLLRSESARPEDEDMLLNFLRGRYNQTLFFFYFTPSFLTI
ncbi:hypothetical protein HPB48_003259 [Haemaphysalis longicornis]|uniref:GH18 domain-containing protein n=1 Tax=Haemaphysalis longicornis TaxID=44386 RepID=A0A9J6GRS5_HAELO|nr:hypothetical protein HPB48_003259 [Haemaphysalis longicornis]